MLTQVSQIRFINITKIVFLNEYCIYLCVNLKFVEVRKIVGKLPVLLLCVLVMCLAGCNKVKDIKVTGVMLENIAPNGLRGLDVALAVGIDNPAFHVELSEIEGALKLSGKVLGRMAMDPFVLHARSVETYHLKASLSIEQGVSFSELLVLTDMATLNKCTVDISVRATLKGGLSKVLRFNDIPMTKLLQR